VEGFHKTIIVAMPTASTLENDLQFFNLNLCMN